MAVITRGDLKYQYRWSADKGDNPQYVGKLDRDKVDRDEGYEVLYFLNSVCKEKDQALKAERLIKMKLPGSVQGRAEILKWLQDNWNS
ncbi:MULTISPECIES: hypothetical protein [Pseudomonas]|uniref:Uncharacterized protein n=1 Tax=Pseudomonas putida TaxID=303 RepID=A0A1L7NFU9_PSEPU|nr:MULTISPECIES: hypothetical protein [Pseudomonas]MBP2082483.1 hypothetical protein [Pseudomonas sp. PvP089]MBP2091898.1 hypothetical protein [Pseudomonas sp. PvP088]MBP2221939.1 hypothetical protein [Pseudomonas putida]MBS6039768.1 hypothetical protein [Pseudomonas sp.]PMY81660.1 hypothetical protein C1X72_08785 [Pseudomonas sp. FW306-2-2C-D06B]